jgi:hypothetical protein
MTAWNWSTQYDVSPDGGRAFFLQSDSQRTRDDIGGVMGWRALVR